MDKKTILVIFGGRSSEHDVSCMSAANVASLIDRNKYDIYLVGITKEGRWILADNIKEITDRTWPMGNVTAMLSADATKHELLLFETTYTKIVHIDVIFPVLHGLYGEDGTIQGLFELSGIPYVGCNVLSSAVSMDKATTKVLVDSIPVRQAKSLLFYRSELTEMESALNRVEDKFFYPVFVKPSAAGSSQGVSKAANREELSDALLLASKHDGKILVEEAIVGRELECAVFGTHEKLIVSPVGEIRSAGEYYDFDSKYNSEDSVTDTNPDLPENIRKEIRDDAAAIFRKCDCFGLARVDFFYDKDGVVFNEINTLPGFTDISMYPMLFEAMGIPKKQLVEDLINTAFLRCEH